jgi:poly(A) polymerase
MDISALRDWLAQSPRTQHLYLVGGTVRDLLLHCKPKDLDLVCRNAREFAYALTRGRNAAVIPMEKGQHRPCYRLVDREDHSNMLDITEMSGETICDDLGQRDFTINAIAIEVGECGSLGALIDPFHGAEDAKKGVIRMTNDHIFTSDPLRILRIFRFSAELDFTTEPSTREEMVKNAGLLKGVSIERIVAELLRILKTPRAAVTFKDMDRLGIIEILFPEIKPMKGFFAGGFIRRSLWEHSLLSIEYCERIINDLPGYFEPWDGEIALHLEQDNLLPLLKLAALLHDIGKPSTKSLDYAQKRDSFPVHNGHGEGIINAISGRMKLSNRDRKLLVLLAEEQPNVQRHAHEEDSQKAEIRWFRKLGEQAVAILVLAIADTLASGENEPAEKCRERYFAHLKGLVCEYYSVLKKKLGTRNLITGGDLIGLGMVPGPELGRILELVRDAQDADEITTYEEAAEMAKKLISWLE